MNRTLSTGLTCIHLAAALWFSPYGRSQAQAQDTTLTSATLEHIIDYALVHQPVVKQAEIDEQVVRKEIQSKIADWYPQINFTYNYQRVLKLQSSVINGNVIHFGVNNTSSAQFTGTQALFNRDVLLAVSTAGEVKALSGLNASRTRIDVAVDVTKAFYDVLATTQQIQVTQESIQRLTQSQQDALNRYNAGVADKTDYKRATIQLNNAKALFRTNTEQLKAKEQYLKSLMGYPGDRDLHIEYNPEDMEAELPMDTLQPLAYASNVDYRILSAQRALQRSNVKYSYWSLLPSLNLFGAYNLNYQNNNFSELYNTLYPYSYVGLTLSLPLFQGGKRLAEIQKQKLTSERMDEGLRALEAQMDAGYQGALAAYKSNLANFNAQKENVDMAQDVYDVIQLQYENGVKTYLDVTLAETDLRTTRINYYNALYEVLASKMDVLRVLGQVNY